MDLQSRQVDSYYQYRPLNHSSCIRVLSLSPGCHGDALYGKLQHCDLDSKIPPFEALSYVWGDPLFTLPLVCDGQILRITANLEIALKRMRSEENDILIWADQVCIDQTNLKERAAQVELMGRIYSTADPVVTWLGPDPLSKAELAFGVLRRFTTSPDLYGVSEDEADALTELSQCAYFSRLWVMQEITNSSHKSTINRVLWGLHQEITMRELTEGLFHIIRLTPMSLPERNAFRWIPEVVGHNDIFGVLAWVRSRQCSDDRDRIYAIIRITTDTSNFWNEWVEHIKPNYSLSVTGVYHEAARRMVECGATAFVLNSVHYESLDPWREGAWPSWIPKWHEDLAFDFKIFKHSPEERVHATYDSQMRLFIDCVPTGIVAACSERPLLFPDSAIDFQQIYDFWLLYTEQHCQVDEHTLLWRHIYFGCAFSAPGKDKLNELDKCSELLQTAYLEYERLLSIMPAYAAKIRSMLDTIQSSVQKLRNLHNAEENERDTPNLAGKETFRGRRLFSTSNAQIGLGPAAVHVGDVVVQIPGSHTPFILRKQEHFYQLVGAAPIPTTMRLAAIDTALTEGHCAKTFEIR